MLQNLKQSKTQSGKLLKEDIVAGTRFADTQGEKQRAETEGGKLSSNNTGNFPSYQIYEIPLWILQSEINENFSSETDINLVIQTSQRRLFVEGSSFIVAAINKVGANNAHIIYLHSSSSSSVLSPSQTSDCKVILRSSESVVMIY